MTSIDGRGGSAGAGWEEATAVGGGDDDVAGERPAPESEDATGLTAEARTPSGVRPIDMAGLVMADELHARLDTAASVDTGATGDADGTKKASAPGLLKLKNIDDLSEGHLRQLGFTQDSATWMKEGEVRYYHWGSVEKHEDGTVEFDLTDETSAKVRALMTRDANLWNMGPDSTAWAIRYILEGDPRKQAGKAFVGTLMLPFAAAYDLIEAAVTPIIFGVQGTRYLVERSKEARALPADERREQRTERRELRPKIRQTAKLDRKRSRLANVRKELSEFPRDIESPRKARLERRAERLEQDIDKLRQFRDS